MDKCYSIDMPEEAVSLEEAMKEEKDLNDLARGQILNILHFINGFGFDNNQSRLTPNLEKAFKQNAFNKKVFGWLDKRKKILQSDVRPKTALTEDRTRTIGSDSFPDLDMPEIPPDGSCIGDYGS